MKRLLMVATGLAALVAVFGFYRPRCAFLKGHGELQRQPHLGGWRCVDCLKAFADLGEAMGDDSGWVSYERVEALNRERVH